MRKKFKKGVVKESMSEDRLEPTFQDPPSTKPGSIRTISVEEYKKQIEAAKKIDAEAARLKAQNDETEKYNQLYSQPKKAAWKKIFSATIGITLISINVALGYFEIQPKIMKPTFSVATPWGVAEVWTPWGTDGKKIAQLDLRKIHPAEKVKEPENTANNDKQEQQ
ncbi:MAG TPA: hypothetical protein VIF82_16150 [Burkholderiaceae bacterium]|jgi:hypothetical protein